MFESYSSRNDLKADIDSKLKGNLNTTVSAT